MTAQTNKEYMPIITKPSTIEKNSPASFSLDKSSLAAVTSVAASPWFGDTANWKKVSLNYLSQQYGEMLFVSFNATQVSPTGTWLAPAICQDVFEIVSISITDFANGTFRVPTSELNPAEFLIDMAVVPPSSFEWDTLFGDVATDGLGELHTIGVASWGNAAYDSTPFVGDFVFSGNLNCLAGPGPGATQENFMLGYRKAFPVSVSGGDPSQNITSCLYMDGGIGAVRLYAGVSSTATTIITTPYTAGIKTFEISRVGSAVSAKFNGVEVFTDSYSGDLYAACMINDINGSAVIDATETPLLFERNFLSPASQEAFEFSATPFGTIQYAASGLRLIQTGPNPSNYQIYYTSPLSAYFPNSSQNYTVTVSYEVISIDAAFVFLKVLLGDVTLTMNSSDPRLSVGVHTNEVFTFNACNVQAGVNSFQFWMNAQDNTEIKFFDYLIEKV